MTQELPEQPGRVPVGELRELVDEWEDGDSGPMLWRDIAKRRKTQLEAVIERYE